VARCNILDPASLGNVANLICQLSDLIHRGFLDAFQFSAECFYMLGVFHMCL
jgi:hypothetical protein